MDLFCWLHTTYSMIHAFNMTLGRSIPYPGVANSGVAKTEVHGHGPHPMVKQHTSYQWVIFVLLFQVRLEAPRVPEELSLNHSESIPFAIKTFCNDDDDDALPCSQAILFYTPRWLWKGWEGGKIHALMMDLDIGLCSEIEKKQKKKMLLDYLWENLRYHNWWAYKYYLCEFLALLNVIGQLVERFRSNLIANQQMCNPGQMFLMNRFFDGAFLTFGIDVLNFLESDQEDRIDPMIYVFPRMTKCTFYKYGVSGEVERHDAVCILPLNVVNEKIYVFLWFWFLILGILSVLTVIYRVRVITFRAIVSCVWMMS